MWVGDRVRVVSLEPNDINETNIEIGDTGVVARRFSDNLFYVKLDRDIVHGVRNWDAEKGAYAFYRKQLESVKKTKSKPVNLTITGNCVDDLFHILACNGYAVQISTTETLDKYNVTVMIEESEEK